MKKSFFALLIVQFFASWCVAQNDDPVIMTINGQNIPRSEFEYSFNKNNSEGVIDKKSIEEYVDLFINYKLKVAAAKDAHLDTLTSFNKEFRTYRDQQLLPSFVTDADMEAKARQVYAATKEQIGPEGLIKPAQILIYLPQSASNEEQIKAKQLADSIYNALKNGADFAELALKYSADESSKQNGGELYWFSRAQALKEFADAAYKLSVGEMSEPVLSPVGYHIIVMKDRKQLEPYEELRGDIMKFLEDRNVREQIANTKIDEEVKQNPSLTKESILDARADELSAKDMNMKYLIQEYNEGLLLFEISNKTVWNAAANDEEGLENFFKKNKKKYAWDEPRFKGIVYHTKEKADVKAVKNTLKGLPFDQWADVLKKTFNSDSVFRIRAEKGIFKRGDNVFADKMIFKVADASPKPLKGYPNDSYYGKMLKKGPEDYTDVKSLVTSDYQEALEKEWVKDLRQRYSFSVNKDVLKTVNKH